MSDESHDKHSLEIIRQFLADKGNVANGIQLVRNKHITSLLMHRMDLLSSQERFKVYEFMEGMFPKHFRRILSVRLREETDQECKEILRAIAEIHNSPP